MTIPTPEQTEMSIMLDHTDVRDMKDATDVRQVFVVRSVTEREKQNGDPYLQLNVGDRTGTVELMVWPVRNSQYDEVARVKEIAEVGALLAVRGKIEVHPQYGTRIKVHEENGRVGVKLAQAGEYDLDRLVMGPARPLEDIEQDLHLLVFNVTNDWCRQLLHTFFGFGPNRGESSEEWIERTDPTFYRAFREAPAARGVHQAYRHGLIEHTLSVAETVKAVAECGALGEVNLDIALTGALLHDIGKIDLYEYEGLAPEMSPVGLLQGEIPLTYARVREAIHALEGFPQVLADAVLHIVVSHHGREEWGAPVEPVTREAWLVHGVDVLAARLGALDMLEATLPAGTEWTNRDRKRGRGWFPTYPESAPAMTES